MLKNNVMYCIYQNIEDNVGFLSQDGLEEDLINANFYSFYAEAIHEGKKAYAEIGEDWEELFNYKFVCILPVKVSLPKEFGGEKS